MPDASLIYNKQYLCINGNNRDNAHITGSPLQRHGEADPYRSLGHPLRAAVLLHRTRVADGDGPELRPLHDRPAVLVFYANYFVLIDHFLFAKRPWKYFLYNVVLIAFAMGAVHLIFELLPHPRWEHPRPEREWQEIVGFFMVNAMLYMLVAGLSVAIKMTGSWYQMESSRRELEKSRAEAELQNLKSQLNPHFLFNTLNNIYSLIAFSPERAQEAVHDLSRLLRYVLYDSSQPMVPLEKELDFIRNYVELMRIRLPEHVKLTTDISAATPETQVAPLLFISLIENAFKHGVSHNKPSFIRNSDFPKDNGQDKSGSGIGLQNLSRRLELLYPSHHIFTYGQKGDEYVCLLELQA